MEQKKTYETPEIEVVEIQWEAPLLMESKDGLKYYHYELE